MSGGCERRTAARAAYRLGMLDALLHPETGLELPGILRRSLKGEREYRIAELNEIGVKVDDLKDLALGTEDDD